MPAVERIQFLSFNTGFVGGEGGENFWKTENGGESWQELTNIFFPVYFLNENIGFCYDGNLLKTINGGDNFDWVSSNGYGGESSDIFAINENIIWGIFGGYFGDPTSQGIFKLSSFNTNNYTEDYTLDNNIEIDMKSIYFANENVGYVAGYKDGKGAIWKNGTGINTMGTNEVEKNNEIKVYPNPASNELNILFNKSINAKIILTDLSGKQIYSKSFQEKQVKINTSELPKGTYVLSVKTGNRNFTKKIIIN